MSSPNCHPSLPPGLAGRLNPVCDRFEAQLLAGAAPRLEDFLPLVDEADRPALLRELQVLERHYRERRGQQATTEEYRRGEFAPAAAPAVESAAPSSTVDPIVARPEPGLALSDEPVTRVLDRGALAPLAIPEQLGKYRIQGVLSDTGSATVYLAHDEELGRQVALKVPQFSPADGTAAVERFVRAARAAASLTHPNLCPVFDAGQIQGITYLTMPHVPGRSLQAVLAEGQPLAPHDAVALVHKLASALQAAHQRGIAHRDLNPTNILITAAGEPLIVDFGLARPLGSSRLTQMGQVLGTPGYLAPEQLSGVPEAQGLGCDIYSLGIILYELLTGEVPFGRTMNEVLLQVMTRDIVLPSSRRPAVPANMDAICAKALARKVEDRYRNMGEFALALERVIRKNDLPSGSPRLAGLSAGTPSIVARADQKGAMGKAGELVPSIDAPQAERIVGLPPWFKPAHGRRRLRPLVLALLLATLGVGLVFVGSRWLFPMIPKNMSAEVARTMVTTTPKVPSTTTPKVVPASLVVGHELILTTFNSGGRNQIVLLELKGTEAKVIKTLTNDTSNHRDPVWSPDGKQIAFSSNRDGVYNIYRMDADGNHVQQLTQRKSSCLSPAWSPDGNQIAFTHTLAAKQLAIFVINADGSAPVNLSLIPTIDSDPAWSPDGSQIAFCSMRAGGGYHLFVMDAKGGNVRKLSTKVNPRGGVFPAWSPDGKEIAYGGSDGDGVELFVCNADGTQLRQVTRLGIDNTRASWSPDGKSITFQHSVGRGASGSLYVMKADGSDLREIPVPGPADAWGPPQWKPR